MNNREVVDGSVKCAGVLRGAFLGWELSDTATRERLGMEADGPIRVRGSKSVFSVRLGGQTFHVEVTPQ